MKRFLKVLSIILGVFTIAASIYFIISKLPLLKEKRNKSVYFVRKVYDKKEDEVA